MKRFRRDLIESQFVDLLFTMLIFFILISNVVPVRNRDVNLINHKTKWQDPVKGGKRTMYVTVTRDGRVYVRCCGHEKGLRGEESIGRILDDFSPSAMIVRADKDSPSGIFQKLLLEASERGIKISIAYVEVK